MVCFGGVKDGVGKTTTAVLRVVRVGYYLDEVGRSYFTRETASAEMMQYSFYMSTCNLMESLLVAINVCS